MQTSRLWTQSKWPRERTRSAGGCCSHPRGRGDGPLDGTVVTSPAPAIPQFFQRVAVAMQWVTGATPLAFAVGLVTAGAWERARPTPHVPHRGSAYRAVLGGRGAAPSAEWLIVFASSKVSFAASMISQGFGIVREVLSGRRVARRSRCSAVIGGSAILGPIVASPRRREPVRHRVALHLPRQRAARGGRVHCCVAAAPRSKKQRGVRSRARRGARQPRGGRAGVPLIQAPESDWPAVGPRDARGGSPCCSRPFVAHERRREKGGQAPLCDATASARVRSPPACSPCSSCLER